ncbi:MAG: hypothetical protein GXP28_03790 [Planctomycetes bacterium]|nr:hypothetical protein [Planctomycetota bacterium]
MPKLNAIDAKRLPVDRLPLGTADFFFALQVARKLQQLRLLLLGHLVDEDAIKDLALGGMIGSRFWQLDRGVANIHELGVVENEFFGQGLPVFSVGGGFDLHTVFKVLQG